MRMSETVRLEAGKTALYMSRADPLMEKQVICCTLVNCNCECFKPGKLKRRQCEQCRHGWVAHALSKLKVHHIYQGSQVEIVHSNVVFDICSLMLYGTQAIPVRLKILLDRLFSVLKQEEVIQILNALDWTLQDYIRGYVLQDATGKVLDRWAIMTYEEEVATLQQFLRFGETKSIVELMAIQDKEGQAVIVPSTRTNSDIRTFIENSTQRSPGLPPKVEKASASNVHHFESFINNMAFMLPFQFLSSVPAPLIGSSPATFQLEHSQGKEPKGRPEDLDPTTESSFLGSGSASFASDCERHGNPQEVSAKVEAGEDFPASDSFSDTPSTPCNASLSSDVSQLSPENKLRSLEKAASSSKKGRVFCSACEKTFYDKGTLKIHYNAVHLKIKHRCTIEGCNMVFSSLRSRNRHSANPNPRLHMPMNRNNRDKDLRNNLTTAETPETEKRSEFGAITTTDTRSVSSYIIPSTDSKLQNNFPNIGQSGILFPNLKTVQPVLPFYRSLVTPAELANTPGTLPSLPLISSSVPVQPPATEPSSEPIPKKKSRKSSMPIKIEKEAIETVGELSEGSGSDDEIPLQMRDKDESESGSTTCEKQAPVNREDSGVIQAADRENSAASVHGQLDTNSNVVEPTGEELEGGLKSLEKGARGTQEGPVIACASPFDSKQREHYNLIRTLPVPELENCSDKQSGNMLCDGEFVSEHRTQNGGLFQFLTNSKDAPASGTDDSSSAIPTMNPHVVCLDKDMPHHCEICNKTFKNPYSVKMHYRNVHLKEMHMCTVDGCNAAFPSRRSRDRHSANLNLHHKLLTKDHYGSSSTIFSPSSLCRDITKDFRQDFPLKEHMGQTSVIFKGNNRMGLVFPMSKMLETNLDPPKESGAEEEAVLDLSTASVIKAGSNTHPSWDSDGGSEEGIPMDDSDESCDGTSLAASEGLQQRWPLTDKSSDCLTQHLPGGSPITCHLCQKVYSNKGTFRAHYKTVHLRLLHKCKVPGCNTMFSSVRSRNRHSQNPNLHRNLSTNTLNEQE
ncbi:zinc finger protein basonuclin-1 isoform X1 [Lepisosteus oculatus]|uniref:Basonuclin zinc finger protein 1 n=1 Tax=Lepisosteus oculatus TaxID=7918 RepID=W5N5H6_LEPOC|nr:PREDICTED: zinc finger protein basonuclin-1 isoform X1 [Lepisosteus oculatus]